jgi:hypothetical protein
MRALAAILTCMDARTALHQLVYRGLLGLRAAAYEDTLTNKMVIGISNVLHNLPGALERAESTADYENALRETWVRSTEQPGGHEWVSDALADMGFDRAWFENPTTPPTM